jgi:putative CocE/NonD family hydrolase
MAALEARADTLSFTSAAFDTDVDLVGDVAVDLAIASDTAHTDFFVVLCDVDKRGRAYHICDGYRRLRPENAGENPVTVTPEGLTGTIRINCWPTAYRLRAGHHLRLIVASGAHPRYTRNLGYGDPLASATRMRKTNQTVFHHANAVSCVHVSQV